MNLRDISLRVKLVHPNARAPERKSEFAAGLDLYSCEDVTIAPGERRVVNTGVAVEIPHGYAGWVKSRSGLCREGFTVDAGLVDSDYRGEVGIQCWNINEIGEEWIQPPIGIPFPNPVRYRNWYIRAGERIAQLVVVPIGVASVVVVDELDDTTRGASGFGSSGQR